MGGPDCQTRDVDCTQPVIHLCRMTATAARIMVINDGTSAGCKRSQFIEWHLLAKLCSPSALIPIINDPIVGIRKNQITRG